MWKSDLKRNSMDLEFAGMADKPEVFNRIIRDAGATNYKPILTSKSRSLTIKLPESQNVSFNRPFNDQLENINRFLDIALEYNELAKKICYNLDITDISKV